MSWERKPLNPRHQCYDACEAIETVFKLLGQTGHLPELNDVVAEYRALKNVMWEETNRVKPKEGFQEARP